MTVPARRSVTATALAAKNADTSWKPAAACRGIDPDLFFPVGSGAPGEMDTEAMEEIAAAMCRSLDCPVRADCLNYAMAYPAEPMGVWGGMSTKARMKLQRRLARERREALRAAETPVELAAAS
jgi:WhiB family redox-sensing transcriptional regulator